MNEEIKEKIEILTKISESSEYRKRPNGDTYLVFTDDEALTFSVKNIGY